MYPHLKSPSSLMTASTRIYAFHCSPSPTFQAPNFTQKTIPDCLARTRIQLYPAYLSDSSTTLQPTIPTPIVQSADWLLLFHGIWKSSRTTRPPTLEIPTQVFLLLLQVDFSTLFTSLLQGCNWTALASVSESVWRKPVPMEKEHSWEYFCLCFFFSLFLLVLGFELRAL